MKLKILQGNFAICKLESVKNVNFESDMVFLSKTDEEISLVCKEECIPSDVIKSESGWNGFKIAECFDFNQVGIISKISDALAVCKIAIFVVSTYNTDYVFVKSERFPRAMEIMIDSGHTIVTD